MNCWPMAARSFGHWPGAWLRRISASNHPLPPARSIKFAISSVVNSNRIELHAATQTAPGGAPTSAPTGTLTLDAANNLTLASLTTTQQHSTDQQKKDLAWQVVKGSGAVDETTQYTRLGAAQLNLSAGSRIHADLSVRASAALLANEPGMGWLQQLQADPALNSKIDWHQIEEAHQQWDYKQQGLTPAAAVVVAVVVAYFTAGAGSAALGTTTATATGTTTTLAGTTLATTTTAGAVGYSTTGVIVNAAVSTLASQAAVSLINNGGQLDKTLKDLGSKRNLRQLATAVATAGVLSEVGQFNFGSTDQPFTLNSVSVQDGFAANVGKNLLTGLARASVNSAVTGTDLESSLRTEIVASVLNAASAQGANFVGDQALAGGLLNDAGQVNEFARAFAHAVVGCAAGAAGASASGSGTPGASGCGAGALGAVVGELSAQLHGNANPAKTIAFASMMGGIAAAAAGLDAQAVSIAASTGANAAQNNYLTHAQEAQRDKELAACKTNFVCKAGVKLNYVGISVKQEAGLLVGVFGGLGYQTYEQGVAVVEMVKNLPETLAALHAIVNDPEFRARVGDAVVNDYQQRIEMQTRAYNEGGWDGSVTAGVEAGRLAVDIVSAGTAAVGMGKLVAVTAKAGAGVIAEALAQSSLATTQLIENMALKGVQVGAIQGFKSAEEVNSLMNAFNKAPAWKSGTTVAETTITPGTRVQMVVDAAAFKAIRTGDTSEAFGGWATFDNVPNQAYARNQLAITEGFKKDVGYVIEVEITKPIQAQIGVVGNQGAATGGGNQLNFLIPPGDRGSTFKYVSGSGKVLP